MPLKIAETMFESDTLNVNIPLGGETMLMRTMCPSGTIAEATPNVIGAGVCVASGTGPYVGTGELTNGTGKPPLDKGDGDADKTDVSGDGETGGGESTAVRVVEDGDGDGVASGCEAAPIAKATSAASSAIAHRRCVAHEPSTLGYLLFLAAHGRREQRLISVAREEHGDEIAFEPLDRALAELAVVDRVADAELALGFFGCFICRRGDFLQRRESASAVVARAAVRQVVVFAEVVEDELAPAAARLAVLEHHRELALIVRPF